MIADEAAIMRDHGAYWSTRLADGVAVVFGPVSDPAGNWGLAIVVRSPRWRSGDEKT